MTPTEAADLLKAAFPNDSICIGMDVWHHARHPGHERDIDYGVSVLPGPCPSEHKVSQFNGKTLEIAVERALHAACPPVIDDDVLNEQFAEPPPETVKAGVLNAH